MARRSARADAVQELREAAVEGLGEEGVGVEAVEGDAFVEEKLRKPRVVDPAVAALFPTGVVVLHEMIAEAAKAWRDATEREAPSVERLSAPGVVTRVDVDATSGYVSVVTSDEVWRAFLPREQLATVVALMLRRPIEEVARAMAEGPGALTPAG